MWNVELVNKEKNVIGLTWHGLVKAEDIEAANQSIEAVRGELEGNEFDLLVNMSDFMAFPPDAQAALARHQKWLLSIGMRRAAVACGKAVTKMQLKRTARESGHGKEVQFESLQEARSFLGV